MGKQCKQWHILFSWAPKSLQMVTAFLGRKARQHIKKQRHYFADKIHLVKAMVFPVVMYGCESWTIKKAEHQRIDAFELQCWRRLLRSPWTERRSNQSILKEMSPEYSLEGLMLKLQYFGHLMWQNDSLENTLVLGKIAGRRKREWQRMRWLDGHESEQALGVGDEWGSLVCCSPWGHSVLHNWVTELNWTYKC